MKRLITSLLIVAFLIPSAFAAQFYSDYQNSFAQKERRELFPINITAHADNEITVSKGMNLLITLERDLLWHKVDTLTATGTAVDNGRLEATINVEYLDDYKVLHIPVKSDWLTGESAIISGMTFRAYNQVPISYMGLDLDGDKIADATDTNMYKVTSETKSDKTPPYPVENLEYTVNESKTEVQLTWKNPPDSDLVTTVVDRMRTRGTYTSPFLELTSGTLTTEYTDNDVMPGDILTYRVYARDTNNQGEVIEIVVDLTEEEPTPDPDPEMNPDPQTPNPEIEDLNKFYNYYKVRHAIKCKTEDSSICLWAKIHLLYAQEIASLSDVDLSLSERELYLMGIRLKWPEKRYQERCIEASTPHKTCNALEKSIKRAKYFLSQ